MKKLFIAGLLLLSTVAAQAVDKIYSVYDFSGGLLDIYSAERMPDKFSPFMANVKLDEDMGITVKTGSIRDNTTPISSAPITSLYNYRKNDGTHYLIAQSSYSLFYSKGTGSYILIKNTFTTTDLMTYSTALDNLYGGNGTDNEWYWDGSTITDFTVTNSTSMVKARYHCWFKNHLFRAGVNGTLSTLYYSAIQDPADNEGGIFVSQDDGDKITGVFPSATGDYLIITKQFSTWGLYGSGTDDWTLKCINPSIGCLYGTTVDYLNGNVIWVSGRGVELFDGTQFTLLSQNIDNQIKNLKQLNVNSSIINQNGDWGTGSVSVNIDTTTNAGRVSMASYLDQSVSTTGAGGYPSLVAGYYYIRQSFQLERNSNLTKVVIYNQYPTPWEFRIRDSNFNLIYSSANPSSSSFILNNSLIANTTYYLEWYSYGLNAIKPNCSYGEYSRGEMYYTDYGGTWIPNDPWDMPFDIYVYASSSSYTTKAYETSGLGSWGSLIVRDVVPSSSTISYYYKTANDPNDLPAKPLIPITNNSSIVSQDSAYVQITASFTRTNIGANPLFDDITISYFSNNSIQPTGKTFESSYNLAVSTGASTTNNVIYNFNKAGVWDMYDDMSAASMAIYRGKLYFGSPISDGYIYKQNIDGVYTNSGTGYKAIYQTKVLDFGSPIMDKYIKSIYITTQSRSNTINLSYRTGGGNDSWSTTEFSIDSTNGRIVTQKINFPQALKSKYIQFQFDSMDYFNIRGFSIVYEELPLQ